MYKERSTIKLNFKTAEMSKDEMCTNEVYHLLPIVMMMIKNMLLMV